MQNYFKIKTLFNFKEKNNNNGFDLSILNNQLIELIRQDPSQLEQILNCKKNIKFLINISKSYFQVILLRYIIVLKELDGQISLFWLLSKVY